MAEVINTTIKNFKADTKNTSANRSFGARVVKPGRYEVAEDAPVKSTPRMFPGRQDAYYSTDVTCKDGTILSIDGLLKQTLSEDGTSLQYVNGFAVGREDVNSMLEHIAGKTVVVSDKVVNTYSQYRNGAMVAPYINGRAYVATVE